MLMGLRFRKSIKIAPGVKINLNKNSVSATVGTKGAHYTVNSKGKKTTTVGVPGTGISYTASSGGNAKKAANNNPSNTSNNGIDSSSPKKKRGKGCLTVFIVLFVLGGICSLFTDDNDPTKITISADTQTVYDINTPIPITAKYEPSDAKTDDITCESSGGSFTNDDGKLSFIADKSGNYKVYITCGNTESNSLTLKIENKKEMAEEAERKEEAGTQTEQETTSQQPQATSYVINTSTRKFHYPSCKDVSKISSENYSTYEGVRDDLINQGYSPCGHCNP